MGTKEEKEKLDKICKDFCDITHDVLVEHGSSYVSESLICLAFKTQMIKIIETLLEQGE